MSLLNVYRKEIDRQTKEVLFQNKIIIGMAVVIGILLFMSFTYVDKLVELSETKKQLNVQIKELESENDALQADYSQSERLLNDARVKLLGGYKNAVDEIIREIRDTYYIDDIPLTKIEQKYIHKIADMYELDYKLVIGLIDLESSFDINAIGINKDKDGNVTSKDYSYMQFNSGNEEWVESKLGRDLNLMSFKDNIDGGMWLLDYYMEDNIYKGLTQFNKGKAGTRKYYNKHLTYKSDYAKLVLGRKSRYE